MKILKKLEKSKTFWFLLGISFLFFLLRLPSLIEPNWYGDEGIYQVIGKAMVNNSMLYTQIWDNKPPLLYITYALLNGEQFQVRMFSLISGLIAVVAFFYLSRLLFKSLKSSVISTFLFAVLFATPIMEGNIANAENFMLFPVITAGLLIYKISIKDHKPSAIRYLLISAGLLLGIAFLYKIVAFFDFAAFIIFLLITNFPKRLSLTFRGIKADYRSHVVPLTPMLAGFLIPLLIAGLYFISQNAFSEFVRAVFSSNVDYVGYSNKLLIPQGLLILKVFLLITGLVLIFLKRTETAKPVIFVLLWFVLSLFNTFFSGRPYTHYTLVLLPSLCLLAGFLFELNKSRIRNIIFIAVIVSIVILSNTFKFNLNNAFLYYGNAVAFVTGGKDVYSYQNFFDRKTPRDYEIAQYLRTRTKSDDNIFIWGDSAQIYTLSNKLPPGKYTVSYHITQYKNALPETEQALRKSNPKYVIILNESKAFPFSLPGYDNKIFFNESVIYERSL